MSFCFGPYYDEAFYIVFFVFDEFFLGFLSLKMLEVVVWWFLVVFGGLL